MHKVLRQTDRHRSDIPTSWAPVGAKNNRIQQTFILYMLYGIRAVEIRLLIISLEQSSEVITVFLTVSNNAVDL